MGSDLRIAEGNGIMDLKKKETKTYELVSKFKLSIPTFHFSIIHGAYQPRRFQKTKFFSRLNKFQDVN